jgi:membrane protease subunit HflK
LYLETMEDVLRDMDKVLLQSDGGAGVLPYLPLDRLIQPKAKGDAEAGSKRGAGK